MGIFCGNCGARVEDTAKVCGNCGAIIQQDEFASLHTTTNSRRKPNPLLLVGLAAIAIVCIIVVLSTVSNKGYEKLVSASVNALVEQDIDTLIELSSDIYSASKNEDDVSQLESIYKYVAEELAERFEDEVGHRYKTSFKIEEVSEPSKRKTEKLLDYLEEYIDEDEFDLGKIKKVILAEVVVTAKKGRFSDEQTVYFTMMQEGRDWKLLLITLDNSGF